MAATTKPRWQQVICRTHRDDQQAISDAMEAAGAVSITYQDAGDQPVLEPLPGETPLWNDIIITGLFSENFERIPFLLFELKDHPSWEIKELRTEVLEDQDWERAWMKDFQPMKFGDNLWIYPSWSEMPDDNSVKILLDPGLAFGTGTHPTTALCLEWLDQHPPQDKTVIDFGCGSGILAIAAAKLGAKEIHATDIDEQALIATQDNMQRNQIDAKRILTCMPENLAVQEADLVLANILSEPLITLSTQLISLLKPNGQIVLSGILQTQLDAVLAAYSNELEDIEIKELKEWVRISARKISK